MGWGWGMAGPLLHLLCLASVFESPFITQPSQNLPKVGLLTLAARLPYPVASPPEP